MSRSWGFGIVPASDNRDARTLLEELCGLASTRGGIVVTPRIATSYTELETGLEDGSLGLAWLPPVPTIDLDAREVASVLAIPSRRGSTSYHAAFIVRRGGPKTLEDLRGRRAAWVHRDSAAGYLIPRMYMVAQGHEVLRFFARELFVHSHAAVVDAVVNGEADVGATFCNVDPRTGKVLRGAWLDDKGETIRPIEPIGTMGPIPNDALVAANALPAAGRAAMTRWLLALQSSTEPHDARALELFGKLLAATDFRVPSRDHYDALRHTLRAARARGHDALPPDSRMRVRTPR